MRNQSFYAAPTAEIVFLEEADVIRTSELNKVEEVGEDLLVTWK